jgi:uncharacterized membrane protein YtjA (UPF0391 family)
MGQWPRAVNFPLESRTAGRRVGFLSAGDVAQFGRGHMLRLALLFLIIAIVAAVLGFGGIAATAAGIAKVLFFIFLVVFLVFLVMGLAAGGSIF